MEQVGSFGSSEVSKEVKEVVRKVETPTLIYIEANHGYIYIWKGNRVKAAEIRFIKG